MSEARPQNHWYIQAAGRVWGPYPAARLESFAREGRVTPSTRIAPHPDGPFTPARESRELQALLAPGRAPEPSAPEPAAPAPSTPLRSLLVWADLVSLDPTRFEAELALYGALAPVRRGLWLVKARLEPAALRNALSRRLRGDDALLVVEAPLDRTAWFNLGGTAERHLRHLWGGAEG
jgi:hypothetical protein